MKPFLGLPVIFFSESKEQIAAVIVRVWTDTCVNLRLFPDAEHAGAGAEWRTSVTFDDSATPQVRTWNVLEAMKPPVREIKEDGNPNPVSQ